MKKTLTIDEAQLQRLATASLIGLVYEEGLEELELVFPQTSLAWRQEHGGPDQWIVEEYNVPCLVDDVAKLVARGVKVVVLQPEKT